MKTFLKIVFAVIFLGLTACAGSENSSGQTETPGSAQAMAMDNQFPNIDGTLFGKWNAGEYESPEGDAKFVVTMYYGDSKIGMTSACTNPEGKTVFASLTVRAIYTKGGIETLEDAEANTPNGDRNCLITVKKGKVLYKLVTNDRLEIKSSKEMSPLKLKRIK